MGSREVEPANSDTTQRVSAFAAPEQDLDLIPFAADYDPTPVEVEKHHAAKRTWAQRQIGRRGRAFVGADGRIRVLWRNRRPRVATLRVVRRAECSGRPRAGHRRTSGTRAGPDGEGPQGDLDEDHHAAPDLIGGGV